MNRLSFPSRVDWVSSMVVFIVALPLTLGISLASGASASAGVISAVIGGILVGALSGAPLVVSGPAAGLSALIFMIIQTHGLIGLAVATLTAGLLQLLMGTFRLGFLFTYVPKSILEGMLAAIGITILLGQLHVVLGGKVPSSPIQSILLLPNSISNAVIPVLALGLVGFAIQLCWTRFAKKLAWIPGALPAVVIVTLIGLSFDGIPRVELSSIGDAISTQLSLWTTLSTDLLNFSMVAVGLGLGVVASAESLLTARAIETMAINKGVHFKTDLDRELIAQGVGNTLCGALGALPMTGVIVRSAANIECGAKTRWSTILHGAWIALFVLAIPQVLNYIPLSVLATVLILTGWKLLNLSKVIQGIRSREFDTAFWFITVASILATDLLKGLILSLVIFTAHHFIFRRGAKQQTPNTVTKGTNPLGKTA